jgi:hypothetical protein
MVALPCALDCSSGIWTQTADQPMPCTCARKKIGAAADRIEACHQKFMLRRRRKTSQRFSRCSASREPLVSDPDAHGSHPTREAATSCGLSICRRLLYLVWLTLCERLTLVGSVPKHKAVNKGVQDYGQSRTLEPRSRASEKEDSITHSGRAGLSLS